MLDFHENLDAALIVEFINFRRTGGLSCENGRSSNKQLRWVYSKFTNSRRQGWVGLSEQHTTIWAVFVQYIDVTGWRSTRDGVPGLTHSRVPNLYEARSVWNFDSEQLVIEAIYQFRMGDVSNLVDDAFFTYSEKVAKLNNSNESAASDFVCGKWNVNIVNDTFNRTRCLIDYLCTDELLDSRSG